MAGSEGYRGALSDLMRLSGFAVVHFRPAQNRRGQWSTPLEADAEGWPDLVGLLPPHVVAIEVKRDREDPTPEQLRWLSLFAELPGGFAWALRPRDGIDRPRAWLRALRTHGPATAEPPKTFGWDGSTVRPGRTRR